MFLKKEPSLIKDVFNKKKTWQSNTNLVEQSGTRWSELSQVRIQRISLSLVCLHFGIQSSPFLLHFQQILSHKVLLLNELHPFSIRLRTSLARFRSAFISLKLFDAAVKWSCNPTFERYSFIRLSSDMFDTLRPDPYLEHFDLSCLLFRFWDGRVPFSLDGLHRQLCFMHFFSVFDALLFNFLSMKQTL